MKKPGAKWIQAIDGKRTRRQTQLRTMPTCIASHLSFFATHLSYGLSSKPSFSSTSVYRLCHSNADSIMPYNAFKILMYRTFLLPSYRASFRYSGFTSQYYINMLNVGEDAFQKFKNIRRELYSKTVGTSFTQMTAKRGIKMLGEAAIAALFKEYQQLKDLKALGRIDPDLLSEDNKHKALRAVNLIKIKRCGKVKGRTCADESVQRNYVQREEASSPTLSDEALMCLLLVNSFGNRDIAAFDVPGAYLHAAIPKDKSAILKIEDEFVNIMYDVNPEYLNDARYEGKRKVLYVRILKALYVMIESALLWHSLYTEVLEKEGFELKPYDRCVANKMINGKQCTLAWYVDNNILSHSDSKVVDQLLRTIESYFPALVIERGRNSTI